MSTRSERERETIREISYHKAIETPYCTCSSISRIAKSRPFLYQYSVYVVNPLIVLWP